MDQNTVENNKNEKEKNNNHRRDSYDEKIYEELNASSFRQCLKNLNDNYKNKKMANELHHLDK